MTDQLPGRAGTGPVVHVITDAGPPGRPHPYFRTLIEAGGINRARVVVGCVGPPGPLQDDMHSLGVRTFALGARSRAGYPMAVARLVWLLRRARASAVQTHLLDGSVVGLLAARLARTPLTILTAHDAHELPFHGRRFMWPERLCAGPLCEHVIAPSEQVKETLVQLAGVQSRKVDVVHHGFDLDHLRPENADGYAIRQELGLEDKFVVGSIGRLYWLKNYPALVEAFVSVFGDDPKTRLVIVGPGDPGPLLRLARARGVAGQVLVSKPRTDVADLLAAFDVFVHPAIAESFGMVIVEAMALSRPVISTPVGIAPEVIHTGHTGVLSSGHDPEALARALREMLEMRSRWGALGEAARARVSGFTAQAMAEQYEALYRKWLWGRRRP